MSSRKDLPSPNAANFLPRVREEIHALLGKLGKSMDRAFTLQDAFDSGLVTQGPGGGLSPGPATEYERDLTPPPPPGGLKASTSGNSIQVTVNPQTYRQGNGPGTITVYGAKYLPGDSLPVFADAAVMDEFPGDVHSFPVDPAGLYRIWAKSVSKDGIPSEPAGGANGVEPTPGLLDDVAIANLTASRIRSGSVTVGQFIQAASFVPSVSGWRINGDGTAEFSQVVVRGTIFASQGLIGGWTIGSNYLQSNTYALGSTGTRLNADGTGQIGGLTVLPDKVRSTTFSESFEGFELGGNGVIRAYSNTGQNVLNTGATGTQFLLKAGSDGFVLRANGEMTTNGKIQSSDGRTYFDPKASGSSPVLSVKDSGFVERVKITADGDAFFTKSLASGTWGCDVQLVGSSTANDSELGSITTFFPTEQEIWIDTGLNKPWGEFYERTMTARIGQITALSTGGNSGAFNGAYIATILIEAIPLTVFPMFKYPFVMVSGQNPYGDYNSRMFIKVRVRLAALHNGLSSYRITSLQWTLDVTG